MALPHLGTSHREQTVNGREFGYTKRFYIDEGRFYVRLYAEDLCEDGDVFEIDMGRFDTEAQADAYIKKLPEPYVAYQREQEIFNGPH